MEEHVDEEDDRRVCTVCLCKDERVRTAVLTHDAPKSELFDLWMLLRLNLG
jgi:hypothetical protein